MFRGGAMIHHSGLVLVGALIICGVWWFVERRPWRRMGVSEGVVAINYYTPNPDTNGWVAIWRTVQRPENLQPTLADQLRYNCYRLDPKFQIGNESPWYSPPERLPNGRYQGFVRVRFHHLSDSA